MIKLFLKVFLIQFLWIILFANLLYVFADLGVFPNYGNAPLTESYFGVSTMIEALKGLNSTPLSSFTSKVLTYQNEMYQQARTYFANRNWELVQNYFANAKDILGFVKAITTLLIAVARSISGVFAYIGAIATYMFYFMLMLFNLVYAIISFINGTYYTPLPNVHVYDVGNCITPLLTAV